MKKNYTLAAISLLTALTLTACSSDKPSSETAGPVAEVELPTGTFAVPTDANITELLPTGSHSVTIEQSSDGVTLAGTGYVDFSDCTTEVTVRADGDSSASYKYVRTADKFEVANRDNKGWFEFVNPDGTFAELLFAPYSLRDVVSQEMGIVCSVLLLDDLGTLGDKTDDGFQIKWTAANRKALIKSEMEAYSETLLRALGATDAEVNEWLPRTMRPDMPTFADMFLDYETYISPAADATSPTVITVKNGPRTVLTMTLTPTDPRTVTPVEYEPFHAKKIAETLKEGLTFKQWIEKRYKSIQESEAAGETGNGSAPSGSNGPTPPGSPEGKPSQSKP
jgi:hypothetical protein